MTIGQLLFYSVLAAIAFFMLRPLIFGGPRITPADAAAQIAAGTAVLIDVRNPGEWRSGAAAPAALLTLGDLQGDRREWKPYLEKNKDKLLIVYCASGMRSGVAAGILKKEGFRVANLGGLGRWSQAGLPVK
ncbi:MAG: rhodanese-like domain-containing protein [Verrucomicrobia bacterium]|nr:rhodanese-like domain-containing protein [Verrucomicrobiota bacterium]